MKIHFVIIARLMYFLWLARLMYFLWLSRVMNLTQNFSPMIFIYNSNQDNFVSWESALEANFTSLSLSQKKKRLLSILLERFCKIDRLITYQTKYYFLSNPVKIANLNRLICSDYHSHKSNMTSSFFNLRINSYSIKKILSICKCCRFKLKLWSTYTSC